MVKFVQQVDPNELHEEVVQKYGKKAVLKQIAAIYQTVISNPKYRHYRPTE